MLSGPQLNPPMGRPDKIVIFLHGVGSDGENLIGLGEYFSDTLPNALFIAPNGPEDFMFTGPGYQWFQLYAENGERLPRNKLMAGVESAAKSVSGFVEELVAEHGLEYKDVILMGFSQGAMTAITTSLTMNEEVGAVIAFSGGLIRDENYTPEVNSQPPICLIHGEDDEVVPVQSSEASSYFFNENNIPSEFYKIPQLGHSIDMRGIQIAQRFLKKYI